MVFVLTTREISSKLWLIHDKTTSLGGGSTYATLIIALKAISASVDSVTSSGGEVSRTGAADRFVEFFAPSESGTSQQDLHEFAGWLRDEYEDSTEALVNAGIPTPSDQEIWDEMKSRMRGVKSHGPSNFVGLFTSNG